MLAAALTRPRDFVDRRRRRIAVVLLPSLAAGWLRPVLADLHAAHPGVELEVAKAPSKACIVPVHGGKADFAVAAIRADTPELPTDVFCSDRPCT